MNLADELAAVMGSDAAVDLELSNVDDDSIATVIRSLCLVPCISEVQLYIQDLYIYKLYYIINFQLYHFWMCFQEIKIELKINL